MTLLLTQSCSVCRQVKEIDISIPGPTMCPECRAKQTKEARDAVILSITEPYVCSCGCSGAIANLAGRLWDLEQRLSQLRG